MNNNLVPIWSKIEALVKGVHGWTPLDQLYTLYTLAFSTSYLEGNILEIGSWCGRSAIVLGSAVRDSSTQSKVYCIDLFPEKNDWTQNKDSTYSFHTRIDNNIFDGYQEQTVWKEAFENQTSKIYEKYNSVLDCFRETISKNDMNNIILPYKGDLSSVLPKLDENFKCRLAFLDGDHGYNAVKQDIINVDKLLVNGGWLCFDDAFSCYEGVNRAITELIIDNPDYDCCQQMTRKFFIARKNSKTV